MRKVKSKSKVKSRISRLHIKEGYVGSSMKVMDRLGDVRYIWGLRLRDFKVEVLCVGVILDYLDFVFLLVIRDK